MSLNKFVVAEQGHVVQVLAPVDITGGATGARFSMAKWNHASVIVMIGASAAAFTKIFVKNCTAYTGGSATAIAFNYYACETASSDVLGVRTASASTGLTPSANDGIFYVIEIDSADLSDGYPWVEISMTNTTNSVLCSCVAILSCGRYDNVASPTVLV